MKINRTVLVRFAVAAGVALAAMGTASVAQARSDVFFSIGANIAPGVTLGVSNARPYYAAPVYYQPAPVYYQPAPVYYQPTPVYYEPSPVYYQPSVYVSPAPIYVRPHHHRGQYYRY